MSIHVYVLMFLRDQKIVQHSIFLESAKAGEGLFRDVLRCKTRADKTRSALTVLQRYRFLFNLPHTIEKNITNVSTGH